MKIPSRASSLFATIIFVCSILLSSLLNFFPAFADTEYDVCKSPSYSDSKGAEKKLPPICVSLNPDGTIRDIGVNSMDGVVGGDNEVPRDIFYYTMKAGEIIITYTDATGTHKSKGFPFEINEFEEDDDFYTKWSDLWGEIQSYIATNITSLGKNNEYTYGYTAPGSPVLDDPGAVTPPSDDVDPNAVTGEKGDAIDETKIDPSCNESSSHAWIVCPLTEGLSSLMNGLFKNIIENQLVIQPDYVDNETTRSTWGVFRDIANILLAVLLLVVIISQVTGVGIDNYGIKKTLPKLIVAAFLINLSFFLCEIVVDLSNIIGSGIMDLFAGINVAGPSGGITVAGGIGMVIAALVGNLLVAIAVPGVLMDIGAVLGLVVGLLGIIISILFFFIILVVRRAGIIALLIISPIAFALYMLPNTKSVFDRWKKTFTTLLLTYPICGLILGASSLIASLVATNEDGFLGELTACIVAVAPIFLVPSVIKSSMNAFGKAGGALMNFGQRIRTGATSGLDRRVRNSERFKEIQGNQNRRRESEYAERRLNTLQRQIAKGEARESAGNLTNRQRSRLDARRRMAARLGGEQRRAANENIQARESLIMNSDTIDQIDDVGTIGSSGYVAGLETQLMEAIVRGDDDAVVAYQNVLSKKGDKGRQAVHNAMLRAEAAGTVSAKTKKTYASNIMNNWASDYKNNSRSTYDYANANAADGTGRNISTFTSGSVGSLKQEQLVAMDDAEIARYLTALENGTITGADATALRNVAAATLANGNLASSLKGDRRRVVEQIAAEPASDYVDTSTGTAVSGTYRVLQSGVVEQLNTRTGKYQALSGPALTNFQTNYLTQREINSTAANHYIDTTSGQDIGEYRVLSNGVVQFNDAGTFRNATAAELAAHSAANSDARVAAIQATHEAEAARRGKVSGFIDGTPADVYMPKTGDGVLVGGGTWSMVGGDAIYTETITNPATGVTRTVKWNGSTGQYM